MTFRLVRTATAGTAVALAYVALVALTAHVDPLDGRPLLDGLTPPPPYRWVSPPPALAAANLPPEDASLDVPIQNGASTVGVFLTPDGQATVLLQQAALPLPQGATKATFRLQALAPPQAAALPPGIDILGNVYRIDYVVGSGRPSTQLTTPAQVALVYPAQAGPAKHHELLRSDDGTTFQAIGGNDNPVGLQVLATSSTLGYFAVGSGGAGAATSVSPPPAAEVSAAPSVAGPTASSATPAPATATPAPRSTPSLLPLALVGAPVALLVLFLVIEVLLRRGRSRRI